MKGGGRRSAFVCRQGLARRKRDARPQTASTAGLMGEGDKDRRGYCRNAAAKKATLCPGFTPRALPAELYRLHLPSVPAGPQRLSAHDRTSAPLSLN